MAVGHERANVCGFSQENNTECRGTTIRWSDGIFQPVLYAAPTSRRYRLHCTLKTDHITPFTTAHRPDVVSICDCTVSRLTSSHLGLECGLTYFCSLVPRCSICRPHSASVPGKFQGCFTCMWLIRNHGLITLCLREGLPAASFAHWFFRPGWTGPVLHSIALVHWIPGMSTCPTLRPRSHTSGL